VVSIKEPFTVTPLSIATVPVVHTASNSADYLLFEPVDAPLSLYTSLADSKLSHVLACNDTDLPIIILQGFKLGDLLTLDEEQCYQIAPSDVTQDLVSLVLHTPPQKAIVPTSIQPPEFVHRSGMTIYSDEVAIAAFSALIDEFPASL
jgi:hypothetical protein